MGKVQVLPEILAHKIAAGEIVERPASVVKELVENSIDAEATRILVEVTDGGKERISIRDNGCGMTREDAELAFRHHATSKIHCFEDLNRVRSLGFRGEALPSIASVSRLRLKTIDGSSEEQAGAGIEIELEGGKTVRIQSVAWPAGTEIVVEDLFFNVPARRKFLKTTSTEIGHITRQFTHYALAYPEVAFRLEHQNRLLVDTPAVASLEDRIYQTLGDSYLENLVPVSYQKENIRVHGFTSLPHEQRSNGNSQYLYVNRRIVRDRVLTHAIRLAYQDLIPSAAYPVVLLFVEIPPEEIDVNVHPSKIEIRFRDSSLVHRAVYHAIEEALLKQRSDLASLARDIPLSQLRVEASGHGRGGVAASLDRFFQRQPDSSFGFPEFRRRSWGSSEPVYRPFDGPEGGPIPAMRADRDPHLNEIPETAHLSAVPVVLGQFVESFIVVSDREGVMLIDQHVAHERILYDQALRRMRKGTTTGQRLLVPLTIELTMQQKSALAEILQELNANGFDVEWFGQRTIAVKSVPVSAAGSAEIPQMLQDILDQSISFSEEEASGSSLQRLREKIAISVSCRAAIKINTPLSPDKMRWMVDELFRCDNPYTCPHGRPIVLRMNIEDVLRGFKRI